MAKSISPTMKVHIPAFAGGILATVDGAIQHGPTLVRAVLVIVGGVVALSSTVATIIRDKGVSVASIEQAGSALAAKLPSLEAELGTVGTLVSTDFPATKATVDSLVRVVGDLQAKVADVPTVAQLVDATKHSILGQPTTPPVA